MPRFAKLQDGKVINVAQAPEDWDQIAPGTWIRSDVAGVGWTYDGNSFYPPSSTLSDAEINRRFRDIDESSDRIELALRAVISLLADQLGVTDQQAKDAVRQRMKAIVEGTRG